jgi:hypothetical protein
MHHPDLVTGRRYWIGETLISGQNGGEFEVGVPEGTGLIGAPRLLHCAAGRQPAGCVAVEVMLSKPVGDVALVEAFQNLGIRGRRGAAPCRLLLGDPA